MVKELNEYVQLVQIFPSLWLVAITKLKYPRCYLPNSSTKTCCDKSIFKKSTSGFNEDFFSSSWLVAIPRSKRLVCICPTPSPLAKFDTRSISKQSKAGLNWVFVLLDQLHYYGYRTQWILLFLYSSREKRWNNDFHMDISTKTNPNSLVVGLSSSFPPMITVTQSAPLCRFLKIWLQRHFIIIILLLLLFWVFLTSFNWWCGYWINKNPITFLKIEIK